MTARSKKNDEYAALISNCPLRPIRTKKDYARAMQVCDSLTDRVEILTAGEQDYLDVLGELIQHYEDEQETYSDKMRVKELCTPRNMLVHLMESNGLSQADLSPEFGAASRVSDFLSGKRELSKSQIQKLATRFAVSPALFFEPVISEELGKYTVRSKIHKQDANEEAEEDDEATLQINIRWTSEALSRVRKVAEKMGVPYQSYIKQVVYRQAVADEKSFCSEGDRESGQA